MSADIDTAALFKTANLGTVPFHMTVGKEVYRLMEAEDLLANMAPKCVAFFFRCSYIQRYSSNVVTARHHRRIVAVQS